MKLRLPLLLRLALLSTAAAYTLGSGCLFADDAPADAAQDDPIAEAVDEEESDSPAIGFEGYTESQLVDIQSSDSAGAVIRQMLENSTTGAVANVGTTSSTSNGATAAAESPALTLSAPAEPATDTTLATTTLSDSAGEGAVAPFFSAEEAAALVVASPATSTPSLKNTSTATLSSFDSPDETISSSSATGATAGSAGASSGGGSASYSLTSSAPDSSSSSLVITTPTDDTSSDPIAEDVLEDPTTEDTTSSTLPHSSASTLATTTSSATTRTLPPLKLLGATSETSTKGTVKVDDADRPSSNDSDKGVQFLYGQMGGSGENVNILYLHAKQTTYPSVVEVTAESFYICPAESNPSFRIGTLKTATSDAIVKIQNNEWSTNYGSSLTLTLGALSVNGSASMEVNQTHTGVIDVSIGKVENSSTEPTTGPLLTSVKNSGKLTLGTNANLSENVDASSVSIGTLTNDGTMTLNGVTTITEKLTNSGTMKLNGVTTITEKLTNSGTMTLNGETTITGSFSNEGKLTNNGTLTLGSGSSLNLDQFNLSYATANVTENGVHTVKTGYLIAWGNGNIINESATISQGETKLSGVTASGNYLILSDAASESCYVVASEISYSDAASGATADGAGTIVVKEGAVLSGVKDSSLNICGEGTVQISGNISYADKTFLDGVLGTVEIGAGDTLDFGASTTGLSLAENLKVLSGGQLTASGSDITRSFELAGGELTSSGSETYSGTITISSASTVSSSKDGTTTLSGALSGSSALAISGEGTVLLSGNISGFTGPISVESGTLQFKVGTQAGKEGSTVSVAKGATLDINGFFDTCFAVKLDGGMLKNGGSDCGEDKRQINEISLTADSILRADKKFGLVGSGYDYTTIDLSGKTLTKEGSADFFACNTALKGGGTLKIAQGNFIFKQEGERIATLGDTDTSADKTNIWLLNGTTLSGGFTMNHAAEFKLNDENADTEGRAKISANIDANSNDATFRVASGDTLTLLGNLTKGGKVTKSEAGILEMSGSNSVSDLTVSGGVVKLTGRTVVETTGGSAIQLNSSGSIQLTGGGELVNDGVTFSALSGKTANLMRNTENLGDFNLWCGGTAGNVSIENAKVSFSSDRKILATLTNVELVNSGDSNYIDLQGEESSLSRLSAGGAFTLSNGNTTTVYGQDSSVSGITTINAKTHLKIAESLSMKSEVKIGTGSDASSSATTASLSIIGSDQSSVVDVTSKQDDAEATITGGVTMKYDSADNKAVIAGAGNGSFATISNAVIDVKENSKLELSNVVLAETTWLHDEETTGDGGSTSTYTGSVDLNGVEGKVTETGEDGGTLQTGTVLTQTGTTGDSAVTQKLEADAKVFKIAYSQITRMASIGGTGLTLDFDTYDGGKGFASLYETLNGKYDYVAIEFDSTVGKIDFSTLVVNAKITNGEDKTGTTTGYYVGDTAVVNATSSSGVVVYFDAMALPEPTTSTLGLLALAALCARRRRSRTRAHA